MLVESLTIPEVKVLTPRRFSDNRGFFAEVYNRQAFSDAGVKVDFVQDNHSLSIAKGVVRGLHYQLPPVPQAKLVRVIRGAILDVAVDIRRSSPTFGMHVKVELSAENFKQIFIPAGFAHGFVTLVQETEVSYKVSSPYSPTHDRGILWNDADLAIDWGVDASTAVLSGKDSKLPRLREASDLF